jgi:hypothetical protein
VSEKFEEPKRKTIEGKYTIQWEIGLGDCGV